jgi:phage terminase large subunit
MQINIITPAWAERLEEAWPHTLIYGGRGGGKSYAVADRIIEEAFQEPLNVLCALESFKTPYRIASYPCS